MKCQIYFYGMLYCMFLIVGLSSCDNRRIQKKTLEEFSARDIIISSDMRQTIGGRDTVLLNPAVGTARLVVWVDSLDCSTCRVNKMFEYTEIVDFSKETGEGFSLIFVFSPTSAKIREVLMNLRISQFDHPVFIDETGVFSAANPHIPADKRFHTFLLDKNGKVVLVGDPVNNPALWELYKTTITQLIENDGVTPTTEK